MDLKEAAITQTNLRHPWEDSRADFFKRLTAKWMDEHQAPVQGLDVGSGDTWLASQLVAELPNGSRFTCVDSSYTPEFLSKLKTPKIEPRLDIPKDQKFDLVTLLDVVEHVPDEQTFLSEVLAQTATGAIVIVSVPAYQSLFTAHDTWLGHFRRYRLNQLRQVMKAADLNVLDSGGLFHSLLYPRALGKLREVVSGPTAAPTGLGQWSHGNILTSSIKNTLNLDWRVSEMLRSVGLTLPGLSWWCVCQKP